MLRRADRFFGDRNAFPLHTTILNTLLNATPLEMISAGISLRKTWPLDERSFAVLPVIPTMNLAYQRRVRGHKCSRSRSTRSLSSVGSRRVLIARLSLHPRGERSATTGYLTHSFALLVTRAACLMSA